ncbi:MAG: hypothetical protein PWP32_1643, partial [Methanothermobacter sp.]|nr:hypothetical protein [Methanothermobacter sp.]
MLLSDEDRPISNADSLHGFSHVIMKIVLSAMLTAFMA